MPDRSSALPLEVIADAHGIARRLEALGLSPPTAQAQAAIFARAAEHLLSSGERPETLAFAFHVPGRIEVLGKHTDYCGGRSLLVATEQAFAFVGVPGRDSLLEIRDVLLGESDSFPISPDLGSTVGHWSNYPRTVARRVARNFPGAFRGCRIAFGSSLPPAAGLSTSSAFLTGTFLVLSRIEGLPSRTPYRENLRSPELLAAYLAAVENGSSFGGLSGDSGVGTQGGSEDHTAILSSRAGEMSVWSFCPVRLEMRLAAPRDCVFAIASSGVAAEKTGKALELYNRASRVARAVAEVWNRAAGGAAPHIAAILAGGPGRPAELRSVLERGEHPEFRPEELLRRLDHFEEESERIVPQAARSIASGNLEALGAIVDRSQERGARLLGNQIPETEYLAREARRLGALAASAFGAGFGGSVWALARASEAAEFIEAWRSAYESAFPHRAASARFFLTAAAPGAADLASGRPAAECSP